MNDRAITTRAGPNVIGGIDAFGGPGDDVLIGSPTDDVLDGGGGTDVLTGDAGADTLSDGDRDGAIAGLAPDADVLDGGSDVDTLSYRQRSRGVVVDLASDDPVGEPGEGDVTRGFEFVRGGKGNDRIAGDREANDLHGGGGSNRLIGRRGDDVLRHASGLEVLCGSGLDFVTGPSARTRIPTGCDRLAIRLPPGASVDEGAAIRPTPHRLGGALGFEVSCPDTDGEPQDCRATVRIRTRFSHRLLATGSIAGYQAQTRFLDLGLTALGRRLHGRRRLASTVIRGPLMRRTAWTIRF
jgi:Ca2+-binding RTX toxin-like protein